ncbi:MAG: porin family protein [Algibacter sp.]
MKSLIPLLFIVFGLNLIAAQEETSATKEIDSLYKEDQFYIGATYNILGTKPSGLNQTGFSLGFHFGFIKDMPINKKRNKAIGIGLGYSTNSFNNNLLVNNDTSGNATYSIIDEAIIGDYTKNKLSQHLIELPIEFRWRTSTPENYNFWRIYTGFKLGYVLSSATKFKGDLGDFKIRNNDNFNDFQYGLSISAGYNTWNIYAYYGLNSIFSNKAKIDDETIDMNAIKIGLIFYIL